MTKLWFLYSYKGGHNYPTKNLMVKKIGVTVTTDGEFMTTPFYGNSLLFIFMGYYDQFVFVFIFKTIYNITLKHYFSSLVIKL